MIKHILKLLWNKKGSNGLMILEIFLSFLVLFAVLSYMLFNTDRLSAPIGFDTDHQKYVLMGELPHFDSLERAEAIRLLESSLRDMELIEDVSFSNSVHPFSGNTWQTGNDDLGFNINSRFVYADEHFATTNELNVVKGRWFTEEDLNSTYKPIVVNQFFLDEYFPDKPMMDSIIPFEGERKIIGVIEDYRYGGEFEELRSTVFLNIASEDQLTETAYIKLDPRADVQYEENINNTVESILKTTSFVILDAAQLKRETSRETWIPIIALLSICTFLCINVALGLFGVLSYNINKRKGEVGLRRAMGAHSTSIMSQFTMEIVLLAVVGILIGAFFAIQLPLLKVIDINPSIFYRGILYAGGIIILIVTICALYPSWQASKIHPALALHED